MIQRVKPLEQQLIENLNVKAEEMHKAKLEKQVVDKLSNSGRNIEPIILEPRRHRSGPVTSLFPFQAIEHNPDNPYNL